MYEERFYRQCISAPYTLEVVYKESDLLICTDKEVKRELVRSLVEKYYTEIENYITVNPRFHNSLSPIDDDHTAPFIAQDMITCSRVTGVGPFASVAGAVALYVGKELLTCADEVIIENGGDIFLKINKGKLVSVYLGEGFKTKNVFIKIAPRPYSFGIASSSASIGHSLNFGCADLVTVIAKDAIVADGFATAFSNRIKKASDAEKVIALAKREDVIEGLVIAIAGKLFLWGALEVE